MNNKLLIRFAEREKNVKNAFLDAYFDPETGDFCEGRAAGNAYGLALGLGDERTKKHLVEKYEVLGRFDTGIFGTSMLLEQLFSIGAGDLAVRLLTNDSEAASFAYMKRMVRRRSGSAGMAENPITIRCLAPVCGCCLHRSLGFG